MLGRVPRNTRGSDGWRGHAQDLSRLERVDEWLNRVGRGHHLVVESAGGSVSNKASTAIAASVERGVNILLIVSY